MSTALAMAEDTTGIGSAGKAEKAIAVKSEALEPRVYCKAGSSGRHEWPPQGKAGHGAKTLP